jgi:hypothetical protein
MSHKGVSVFIVPDQRFQRRTMPLDPIQFQAAWLQRSKLAAGTDGPSEATGRAIPHSKNRWIEPSIGIRNQEC